MIKKIDDIHNYRDYRILLNDDFLARSSQNPSYSLRAYARDLAVSPGFLSDILRGKKDLSVAKGREIFSKLGFEGEEMEYAETLILLRVATDEAQKRELFAYLRQKYNKVFNANDAKDLILKSADHIMIHGIVDGFSSLEKILFITDALEISRERVMEIISEMIKAGYITEKGGEFFIANQNLCVLEHDRLLPVHNQYINRCYDVMQRQGGMSVPNRVANMFILPLNEDSMQLVDEAHRQFAQTICRISSQSKNNDRVMFWADSELTLNSSLDESTGPAGPGKVSRRSSRCWPT